MTDGQSQPQPTPAPMKGKMGWIIGVAVAVLLGLAAWMFWPKSMDDTNTNTAVTNTTTNTADSAAGDTVLAGSELFMAHSGTWSGTWNNITFGSSGGITGTMTVNDDGTAELILDVNGTVFGLADPAPLTMAGTYDANTLILSTADNPVFGDLTLTFNGDGRVIGSGLQIPATNIDTLSITGTATASALNLNYTLTAGNATFAQGILELTKQ